MFIQVIQGVCHDVGALRRQMETWRDELGPKAQGWLGGTYGVSVGFDSSPPLKGYGAMTIQFGSSPENLDKLVAASMKEIERLKKEGPSLDDVNKVKELERRDLETNAKQNAYWLNSMQTVHMFGWDITGINRRLDRTEKLTPEILKAMFNKYFPMDRYTLVTLKPES